MGSPPATPNLPLTTSWLTASPVPPLDGPAGVAERLVLLAHYGADFTIWGQHRRPRYWDALTENIKAATYAGSTLPDWWGRISSQLPTSPRNPQERAETLILITSGDDLPVLHHLRNHPAALTLRARIIAERRNEEQGTQ